MIFRHRRREDRTNAYVYGAMIDFFSYMRRPTKTEYTAALLRIRNFREKTFEKIKAL